MKNSRILNKFGIVTSNVIRDPEISFRAKALYAYLSIFADKTTNELFVSVNKMAAENNISVSTVKRILEELQEKQVITRHSSGESNNKITTLLK